VTEDFYSTLRTEVICKKKLV